MKSLGNTDSCLACPWKRVYSNQRLCCEHPYWFQAEETIVPNTDGTTHTLCPLEDTKELDRQIPCDDTFIEKVTNSAEHPWNSLVVTRKSKFKQELIYWIDLINRNL